MLEKQIIILYMDGLDVNQIAVRLAVSEQCVRDTIFKALNF